MKKYGFSLLKFAAGTVLCCFVSSGCATIVSGSKQEIAIDSIPPGAELYVDDVLVGKTPTKAEIERTKETFLVLKHEGCADTRVKIEQSVNGWFLVNLILPGNIIWVVVDIANDSWKKYLEDDIVVPLLMPDEKRLQLYDKNVVLVNESEK